MIREQKTEKKTVKLNFLPHIKVENLEAKKKFVLYLRFLLKTHTKLMD
jgi:hypothetical protein